MVESVEQIDPAELTVEDVKKRATKGVAILTGRTVVLQVISFVSNVLILPAFLMPEQYGVFFLVSAVINLLTYFSDIGFAASLIQKKEQPTRDDLKTIFTAQQVLVLSLVGIVFIATPFISNFYKFDQNAIYLLWALSLSLVFSSLKTIPSVLLERKLEFNKLVVPQIIEALVFNISVVYCAWQGYGVASFTVGVLLRGISGLVTTYLVQPWLPSISFSFKSFKTLLRFGVPYQANSFLAMLKDDGITIFLGTVLGAYGIGLLGWAQRYAYAPLRFFMDQVIKVTFPAFSRLQNNKEELSKAVSISIKFICLLVFPSLIMLVLTTPILVQIIQKYNKWEAGLVALSILSINCALAAVTTPLTNALNAIGKITLTFKLMIMWTVLTWAFVPFLATSYGLNGAALGLTLVGLSSFVAIYLISKYIKVNYLEAVGKPLIISLLMGGAVFIVKGLFIISALQIGVMIVVGFVSYILAIFLIDYKVINQFRNLFKKSV